MKKIEQWLKQIFLYLFKILLPKISKNKLNLDWKNFQHILVFRLDNRLGNSILILSLIQSIKNSHPRAQVDVLMTSSYTDLYEHHPDINKTIHYDQKHLFRNPLRFIFLIKQLRNNDYDVVFSSSNPDSLSVSQAIFCRMVSSGRSVGFDWGESARIYSDVVKGDINVHYAKAQVDLWRYFDKDAEYTHPKLYFVRRNITEPENSLLIWLGATGNKFVGEELIHSIIQISDELGIDYTLAVGPHDQQILDKYSESIKLNVQAKLLDLNGIANYYMDFKIICMPDTGPMHLVSALNIPLIQIFVDSNIKQYGYTGDRKYIIDRDINKASLIEFIKGNLA